MVDNSTLAYINTSGSVTTDTTDPDLVTPEIQSRINVTAMQTDTVSASADGSTTGDSATGVGVAVAVNIATVDANAYLDGTGSLASSAIDVGATLAGGDTFTSVAKSGVGNTSSLGVAGSFAFNKVSSHANALIKGTADLNLGSTDVRLTSSNTISSFAQAIPHLETGDEDGDGVSGEGFGLGASIAINISENYSY